MTSRRFRVTIAWAESTPERPGSLSPWRVTDARITYTLISTDPDETIATVEAEALATFHVQREDCSRLIVRELFTDPESGQEFTLEP